MSEEILLTLIDEGLSSRKIASRLDVSQSTIKYWLKKFGLKTKVNYTTFDWVCKSCNHRLSHEHFYKNGDSSHTCCKSCLIAKTTDRQRSVKQLALMYKGKACVKCGYDKYNGALHFHHEDPNKKDPNWKGFKLRKFDDAFKAELDKCIVLCANCHAETHKIT